MLNTIFSFLPLIFMFFVLKSVFTKSNKGLDDSINFCRSSNLDLDYTGTNVLGEIGSDGTLNT